ncbi:MAG TPA: hypothetical protein PK453_06950 [Leptospiraceae bacterium]|nr:hypothetical protein [Leptospiraceae bacterium]HMY67546.1 hypothetical protein [Leptospiraceae bacterium]HNF13389.1 hypothetical protein [Leptospiraceae bacterium]HNF26040.1 hypothetical protein [Leptospiraceae bacterium]HNH08444.1 hypothetical protein [Leptospiraceae bacterium]
MKLFKLFTILIVSLSLSFSAGLFAGDKKEKDKKEDKADKKDHKDHKKDGKDGGVSCEKKCGHTHSACEMKNADFPKGSKERKAHNEKCQSDYKSCKSSCKT